MIVQCKVMDSVPTGLIVFTNAIPGEIANGWKAVIIPSSRSLDTTVSVEANVKEGKDPYDAVGWQCQLHIVAQGLVWLPTTDSSAYAWKRVKPGTVFKGFQNGTISTSPGVSGIKRTIEQTQIPIVSPSSPSGMEFAPTTP